MRRAVHLNSFNVLDSVLVVGDRLLVSVVGSGTKDCVEGHLPILVGRGMQERDAKGLNRFRPVLVGDMPEEARQAGERQFEELRDGDDKVHLQVIRKSDIPC